jgi:hypothetical protein
MHFAYLYSRYPVVSQTFCDTEMLALERRGWSFEIGSIHPPLTSLRHGHAARLQAPIHYAPPQEILKIWERRAKESGAWPVALVSMAVCEVVARLVIVQLRGRRLTQQPAVAVGAPA